ncbi:MAG: serine/arginine repetitive matrix protein 2, partial [Evtepia sp.]
AEVRKVKEGSSKPSYGAEDGGIIEITSEVQTRFSRYPRCGEIVCGIWPHVTNIGYLVTSTVKISGGADSGLVEFPKVGTIATSEKFFRSCDFIMYEGIASDIVARSQNSSGSKVYTRCSTVTYCSPSTTREGGKS